MCNLVIMRQLTIISSSEGRETKVNIVPVPTQNSPVETSALGFFFRGVENVCVDLIDATLGENGEASGGQFARHANTGLKTGDWSVRRNSTLGTPPRIEKKYPVRVRHIMLKISAEGDDDHGRGWNRYQL